MKPRFLDRFAPIRDAVLAERTISDSDVFAELRELEGMARQIGPQSSELAQVLSLMSLAQWQRGEPEEAVEFAFSSLEIQDQTGPLPAPEPLRLHHRIASGARQLEDYSLAVKHYREAVKLLDTDAELSESQRLNVREELGFALHAAGQFDDALAANLQLLQDAEQLFGPDDDRLTGVLNNLAQNYIELNNHAAAATLLRRRLELAQNAGNAEIVHDTLFQLGVLAFEMGHVEVAQECLDRCKRHALGSGDPALIEQAGDRLNILAHMLGGGAQVRD